MLWIFQFFLQTFFVDVFLPHDSDTQSGDLDQAYICESNEVGTVIYTLKTDLPTSEIASYSITGELSNYVASQVDSSGEIKLIAQFKVSFKTCFYRSLRLNLEIINIIKYINILTVRSR